MSSPCFYCGARPNVACKHRPADPDWSPPAPVAPDGRSTRDFTGMGHNFRARRTRDETGRRRNA